MSNEEIKGVLTGQVPVSGNPPSGIPDTASLETEDFPECEDHIEVQHRDGKRPWCRSCGWSRGRRAIPPAKIKEIRRG